MDSGTSIENPAVAPYRLPEGLRNDANLASNEIIRWLWLGWTVWMKWISNPREMGETGRSATGRPLITSGRSLGEMSRREKPDRDPHLSLDDVKFFERAMDAYPDVKNTEVAVDFFIPVDEALRGREILVAQHKVCSRFMENYVKECPLSSLQRLFTAFSSHYPDLAVDRFSSHTVEHLITEGLRQIDASVRPSFGEFLASMITELIPSAATLAGDPAGSHVARSIISNLSKADSLSQKVDKFCRKIIQGIVQNPGRLRSSQYSATLQAIASLDSSKYPKLIQYLLKSASFSWETMTDRSGSKFIEVLIQFVGRDAITLAFESVFSRSARDAAYDGIANFVLQRWLESVRDSAQISVVADQLFPKIPDVLRRRPQVVVSLTAGLCYGDLPPQKRMIDILIVESHSQNLVDFLDGLLPPNGSKILQNLCGFDESASQPFVDAVRQLGGEKTCALSISQTGSFFFSEFLKSKKISLSSRLKIVRRMLPKLIDISVNRLGAFVVEAAFQIADMDTKCRICDSLNNERVKQEAAYIWKNFRMDQFRTRRENWVRDTEHIMRRVGAMADIIDEIDIPDVEPLPPMRMEVRPEVEEAAQEIRSELGVIEPPRRRRRHTHRVEDADG
jgi:hypothetical protein